MNRLTAAWTRLRIRDQWAAFRAERAAQTSTRVETRLPATMIGDVGTVVDRRSDTRIDVEEFLTAIADYIERIELDPSVAIDITDVAPGEHWDLVYGVGLGSRVLIRTIGACELLLFKRYMDEVLEESEEVFDEAIAAIRQASAEDEHAGITTEGINVADIVIAEQIDSEYALDPTDIPGLCDLDPKTLLNATQVVLLAFNLTVRRLSGITS